MPPGRLAAILVLGVLTAAVLPFAGAQSKVTIKIATQSPLSGELAGLGEGIKLGAELAMDRLKGTVEKGGFKLELVPFDDQARPDVGVANAKAIVADPDVLLVIGHLNSGVALPASEIYREAGLAMVSPANTSPLITDRGLANVTRVCGRDDVEAEMAARFARDVLKARSAYVVHSRNPYGQWVAEFFQEAAKGLGVQIVGFEGSDEPTGREAILTAIEAKSPDVVYFGGEYPEGAPFFRQAREKGIRARFMGPDGLDSAELLRLGGEAVVGMYVTTVTGGARDYPKAREFAEEYRKRAGKDPGPFAAQAYDATAVGLKALEAAIKDAGGKLPGRDAVSKAVRRVKHAGITGYLEFDDRGDPKKATYLIYQVGKEWKDNRLVRRLELPAPAARKP
jgi:branched-chain amino acid transport system substrate-binding protein